MVRKEGDSLPSFLNLRAGKGFRIEFLKHRSPNPLLHNNSMINELKSISIRGRLAFCLKCLENAFLQEGKTGVESNFILGNLWEFTSSNALDDWEPKIDEITPVCLLDGKFDISEFYIIDHEMVVRLRNFYLSNPEYLNELIDYSISVGVNNIYGNTNEYSSLTLEPTLKVIELCEINNVTIPPIKNFVRFSYNIDNGWGRTFDRNDVG